MKKNFFAIIISTLILTATACGGDSQDELVEPQSVEVEQDSITTIEGEFIHLADDAVLKGSDFIYGVELDSLGKELAKQIEPLKSDEFDMIPVVVRAKIIPNPGLKGWEERIQIREIVELPENNTESSEEPKVRTEIEKP